MEICRPASRCDRTWPALVLAVPVVICVLACAVALWVPMYWSDLKLQAHAEKLYDYPLPPSTVVIDQSSEFRKVGNGNNCLFVAEQCLRSSLTRTEIEAYYADVRLTAITTGWFDEAKTVPIDVEFQEAGVTTRQTYFTVTTWVETSTTLDMRCH